MGDEHKTKQQLLSELADLRRQIAEMTASEVRRKRDDETLHRLLQFENLVASISTGFITLPASEADVGIAHALQTIGEFVEADRSYLFLISQDGRSADNTHEWCAPGIQSQMGMLKGLPLGEFPWFSERLSRKEVIHVPRVADLPPEAAAERKLAEGGDTQSFVCVPMAPRDAVVGFVGLDSVRKPVTWPEDALILLRIVGQIFVTALDRKRSEQTLRESENKFRALVQQLPDGICIHEKGRIVFSNESHWRMLGFSSEEEIIGADGFEFLAPESRELVRQRIEQRLRGEPVPSRYEIKSRRRDGSTFDSEVVATAMTLNGRAVVQVILRDISDRKRAEEALAAEKERLAVTLRSIGDGVITTDTEGKIVLVNKVAETLTGWPQEEAVGRPLAEVFRVFHERTRLPCRSPVEAMLETGGAVGIEGDTLLAARDGTERIIADSAAPIRDKDSKTLGVVLVFRDITEKRKIEEELLKASKLDSVGLLAGGIAHDFNNILTAILGNLSLARAESDPGDQVLRRLGDAEKATLRAKDLTQRLLAFAKGGIPIRRVTRIAGLLRDSASFALSGSQARCEFSISHDLWPADADEGQISQVIHNIVLNATQAMPRGGVIHVRAENIALGPEHLAPVPRGKYIRVTIQDQGVGIPRDHLHKIFDPYFTTKPQGSGLGLTTAYAIVKNHGGCITVESSPGAGTAFCVYLPAAEREPAPAGTEEVTVIAGRGRILLVDDEELVRVVAGEMLTYLGYDVVCAKEGSEGVDLYRQAMDEGRPFDAVILDLTIPGGMGGRDAVQRLREMDPDVKAIVASGYSNDPIMSDFRQYGFCAVVTKPFHVSDLGQILVKAMADRPA